MTKSMNESKDDDLNKIEEKHQVDRPELEKAEDRSYESKEADAD